MSAHLAPAETAPSPLDDRARKAWPFEEAAKLVDRVRALGRGSVLFETGYGPSGLPHIGTFGEVARTSWVRRAFETLQPGIPTRLLAFSDDMDGLRKVPDNVPNKEMLARHLGRPVTAIPDPFGTHESFGAHNNARLRAFLDGFGFDYEFASSTEVYRSGAFDRTLLRMLERLDEVLAVILPTLGPERRATYSPFLPVHPRTGVVMQVPVLERKLDAGTIVWADPDSAERFETPVTGGHCKAQWKADWALRWAALGVDYEMSGKDLIDSVKLSSRICRVLGAEPPVGFTYELFLDERGEKISKSKGNGLSIDEWLRYAPPESLSQFMYANPQRAKKLYFDAIPRVVDDYLQNREKLFREEPAAKPANPAWHIHRGQVPQDAPPPVSFTMLLNLASAANADRPEVLWGYLRRYAPGADAESSPLTAALVERAVAYYRDFVLPGKRFREPDPAERIALQDLARSLAGLDASSTAEEVQTVVYEVGKRHVPQPELKRFFDMLYQVLLGQPEGPRFGGFAAVYGLPETTALIDAALVRTDPIGAEAT